MCLAFPGKIISIDGDQAEVDFDGIIKNVNISLVKKADAGDFVIVHAGFAIQILGEEDAMEVFRLFREAEEKK